MSSLSIGMIVGCVLRFLATFDILSLHGKFYLVVFFIGRENCGTAVSKRCLLLPFGFVAFLLLLVSHAALCRPCPVRAAVAFVACLLRSSERSCLRAVLPCPSLRFLYAQNLVEHVVDDHAVRESLTRLIEELGDALVHDPHDQLSVVRIGDGFSRVDGEPPGCR